MGRRRSIDPDDGYQTIDVKLDLIAEASAPAPGHVWYLAVQSLRQPGSYYFHKAVPTGNGRYVGVIGVGPKESRGIGAYVVSVVDADGSAAAAITQEMTSNTVHYNDFGMPLPIRAVPVVSIKVIRTG